MVDCVRRVDAGISSHHNTIDAVGYHYTVMNKLCVSADIAPVSRGSVASRHRVVSIMKEIKENALKMMHSFSISQSCI